ncbi:MAG: redoxin domain-containing protein [Chloroflexota bacterium]|nr:redoxin domain-containing protein [Chloroflexota bacterium]
MQRQNIARQHLRVLAVALAWVLMGLIGVAGSGDALADPAPAYAATRLDGSGEISLDDLRGEVVLLNGWATWCQPCREEMPLLQQLQEEYGDQGLRVVGVSIDRGEAAGKIEQFANDTGVTFTLLHDPKNAFSRTFRTSGVPETLLIGRDGDVLYRWKGPLQDNAAEREIIRAALDGATTGITAPVAQIAIPVAFVAGLLSFLSPCVLPLIPTYAGVITGLSMKELSSSAPEARQRTRRATFTNGLLFVAGFSAVFIALGASATLLGGWLIEYRVWIARVGGVILLVLGLHLLGLLRIPWLDRTVRVEMANQPAGRAGAFLIGVAFGAGWTPCIGPALAGILTIAAATASVREGVTLLAVYSLGLAIPFLGATVALDRFMSSSGRFRRWLPRLQQASGVLVLIVAVILLTDSMTRLVELAARFEG